MDVRSRLVFWSVILIVNLVVLSVLFYSIYKKSTENDRNDILENPSLTVTDFNPLQDKGFKRATDWGELQSHGTLSATAADFQKGEGCRRVVVFLGRGAVLGHVLDACDSLEPSTWLLVVENVLHYYGRAIVAQDSSEGTFTVAEKLTGERGCLVTNYTVTGDDRPKLKDKSEPQKVRESEDKDCKILIDFKMPPMLLFSRNGMTGKFTSGKIWATVNPWQPLGVVWRMYWYGARCFRLLIITSYGRSVQAVKVSCGSVENLVITENSLYYGDALVVKRNTRADTFELVYNPKRSGDCVKKTVTLSSQEGRPVVSIKSKENVSNEDEECLNLIGGEISGAVVSKDGVSQLVRSLEHNSFGVEPYGASLKDYERYSQWNYFNLPTDLGFAVRYYRSKGLPVRVRRLLLVVAQGVPVAATFVYPGPLQRLVMRDDILIFNTTIMLRKNKDENNITVLIKVDEYSCFRKSYVLKKENGITVKEELSPGREVTISLDEDCLNLIDGRKLKHPELGQFGVETDEYGVPMDLPVGVNVSGGSSGDGAEENKPHADY